jgi:hypothetical protein
MTEQVSSTKHQATHYVRDDTEHFCDAEVIHITMNNR